MASIDPKVIKEKITKSRISLLISQPFFGPLATRLIPKVANDWVPTAGTDGKYFYYNEEFLADLDDQEMLFLMCHECFHNIYDHLGRRGSRDPKLFNAAADFVINLEISDAKIGKLIRRPGTCEPCYDERFRGMASEEVYEILKKEQEKNGKQYDSFDMHIYPDGTTHGEKEGSEGGPVPMTAEERSMLREEIKATVAQVAKNAGAGNVPAGVRRLIQDLEEPKMDWREHLRLTAMSVVKNDYTFSTPSRRSWSTGGAILPGMPPDYKCNIAISIDTSGSMGDEMLRELLSEVKGITEQFADFEIDLWTFDTKVYNRQTFTPENVDELLEYDLQGGGGTQFEANWDFMKENDIVPHIFLMFTDGYNCGPGWGDPDYCETIFLVHSNPEQNLEADFGTTLYYE